MGSLMNESSSQPSNLESARTRRKRLPLSIAEILDLDSALVEAFAAVRSVRERHRVALNIKYPPLPSVFSESIVIAAAEKLFGPEWKAEYGGADCDVILHNNSGSARAVEVKATGEHEFQELKAKDLRAHFLVWVRFGRRYRDGSGGIVIAILETPGTYIARPCRLDTARLEKIPGVADALNVMAFQSLAELLSSR